MTEPVISHEGDRATVAIDGDLTASTVAHWRTVVADLANGGARQVVFDLAASRVVDSSGIGLLLAAHNSMRRGGGQIAVANASPDVVALFRAMRLDKHFAVGGR
jgi:anti-anti-sigma factor